MNIYFFGPSWSNIGQGWDLRYKKRLFKRTIFLEAEKIELQNKLNFSKTRSLIF
jgi:hypothetical protein